MARLSKKKKKLLNIKCVFSFFYTFYLKHLFWEKLIEIWSKIYICLHAKYPLLLSDFNETWTFSTDIRIILKHKFHKIRSVAAELFRADTRTERQTRRSWESLFAILRTRLKTKRSGITYLLYYCTAVVPHNCKACKHCSVHTTYMTKMTDGRENCFYLTISVVKFI